MKNFESLKKNSIRLEIQDDYFGNSKSYFGGLPLVDSNFNWPTFLSDEFDSPSLNNEIKERPLQFICQIDLEEASKFDKDNLLPKKVF